MTSNDRPVRRLIEQPGVDQLEYRAIIKRDMAEPEARAEYPEIDECVRALFGLTTDEAEAVERPAGWDNIDARSLEVQAEAFAAEGWDVTDNRRRPLRVLAHFSTPLWLALRGVAGTLPFQPESDKPEAWVSKLQADAKRFTRR